MTSGFFMGECSVCSKMIQDEKNKVMSKQQISIVFYGNLLLRHFFEK